MALTHLVLLGLKVIASDLRTGSQTAATTRASHSAQVCVASSMFLTSAVGERVTYTIVNFWAAAIAAGAHRCALGCQCVWYKLLPALPRKHRTTSWLPQFLAFSVHDSCVSLVSQCSWAAEFDAVVLLQTETSASQRKRAQDCAPEPDDGNPKV